MFFLLYKRTDNGVFDDFPKISEDFSKLSRRPDERFRTFPENFREFPKMSEDVRRLPKTFEEDPKMFRWYTNEFKYNLRDKPDATEIIDIFTCEDIVSFLWICYYSLYHWLLYNKYYYYYCNRIYNKILDRDWFSSRLFSHVIGARSRGCPITGVRFELFVIGHL